MSEPTQPDPATEPIPVQPDPADDDNRMPFPWVDVVITSVEMLVLAGVGLGLVLEADRLSRIGGLLCGAVAGYLVAQLIQLIQLPRNSYDEVDDCDVCDDYDDDHDQERGADDTADDTAGNAAPDGGQP